MVLGKLPVLGRPAYLDWSRARAYCACSRCGWGWFGHFLLSSILSLLSPSLWETARYRLKYCLKGPVLGRPAYLDWSRARAYCACSRCGWGWFGHFLLSSILSLLSPSLWETARYRLKYCLKGPLNPKQPTNHLLQRSLSPSLSLSLSLSAAEYNFSFVSYFTRFHWSTNAYVKI